MVVIGFEAGGELGVVGQHVVANAEAEQPVTDEDRRRIEALIADLSGG